MLMLQLCYVMGTSLLGKVWCDTGLARSGGRELDIWDGDEAQLEFGFGFGFLFDCQFKIAYCTYHTPLHIAIILYPYTFYSYIQTCTYSYPQFFTINLEKR